MVRTEVGNEMDSRAPDEKAKLPIEVTEVGMKMDLKDELEPKTFSPMLEIEVGIEMERREVQ